MTQNNKTLTEEVTKSIAHLSRLELSESEIKNYTVQLGNILGHIEKLNEVNVQGIVPLVQPIEMTLSLREDEVVESQKDSQGQPKVLESAPEVLYEGYKVPQIL